TALARRAYRRTATEAEITTLMSFYQQGRKNDDFETGIQQAMARLPVAPAFLYRVEEEPAGLAEGGIYRLSDLELASRPSFFLWSTIPYAAPLDVASRGKLSDPKVLEHQLKRVLADSMSH